MCPVMWISSGRIPGVVWGKSGICLEAVGQTFAIYLEAVWSRRGKDLATGRSACYLHLVLHLVLTKLSQHTDTSALDLIIVLLNA